MGVYEISIFFCSAIFRRVGSIFTAKSYILQLTLFFLMTFFIILQNPIDFLKIKYRHGIIDDINIYGRSWPNQYLFYPLLYSEIATPVTMLSKVLQQENVVEST